MSDEPAEWDYFDQDGAIFRRPAGNIGGVTHILNDQEWHPYMGNRTKPALYGDRISDPLGGLVDQVAASLAVFIKVGAVGYVRRDGTTVAAHTGSPPVWEWYVHKVTKNEIEHRKVMADGKPNFGGSGKKMRRVYEYPSGTVYATTERWTVSRHDTVEAAKAWLDR